VAAASARVADQLDQPAWEQANPHEDLREDFWVGATDPVQIVIGCLGFLAGRRRCEAGPLELRFNS
jgi:hypothetical protein